MQRLDRTLTLDMLFEKICKSMKSYRRFKCLESYAVFMGKAKLIEFCLKKILCKRYRYTEKKLERMTLGGAVAELDRLGMRKDFISLLRDLNTHRIGGA